jgi:hypothetical protein
LRERIPHAFWIFVYCHVTLVSLLIFRVRSVHQLGDFLETLFTRFGDFTLHIMRSSPVTLLGIPIFLVLDYLSYRTQKERFFGVWWPPARGALFASLFVLVLMGWSAAPAEFIYFKF